ncbi:MAG TPA: hypothetical protein VN626_01425 [Clostridia bacterium]|nr:hypothetical protein [Clostridia bacterium]
MSCNRASNIQSNNNRNNSLQFSRQAAGCFGGTSCSCAGGSCCGTGTTSDPCLQSMRYVLTAIDDVVRNMPSGFSIDVEITTVDGTTHTVTFNNTTYAVRVTGTTLTAGDLVISICAIAKIRVLSGELVGSTFETQLLTALSCLSSRCCGDFNCADACTKDLQNYLYCHQSSIAAVSYDGGLEIIQNILAPTGINYVNVVGSASLSTTTGSVLSGASLDTDSTSVVSAVTPSLTSVVTGVTANNLDVVTGVTGVPVAVSAPITSVPTTVVTGVTTTPVAGLAQNLTTTTASVIDEIATGTTTVLTGLGTPTTLAGVLSGLTAASSVTPTTVLVPFFTSGNAGPLIVTIEGVDYPVTSGGDDVVYGGTLAAFVFPSGANFLGGVTGTPTISTITQQGTPTTSSVISTITPGTADVIATVTSGTASGLFVNTVSTGTVGSVTSPASITALSGVSVSTENINALGTVSTTPASSLFTTSTTDVLDSATLSTTTTSALTSASLSTSTQNVVQSISTTLIDVAIPASEDIDGSVSSVGCGIMAVENDDGDVSVYSVCDINAVETD